MDPGHGWKGSARSSAITPSPCRCCERHHRPAAGALMSSQDILLAGCAAPAPQKESPLRCCSLAFPRAGIPERLPTDRACRGPPRLCPHAPSVLAGRPPGLAGRRGPKGVSGALQSSPASSPCARARPCLLAAPRGSRLTRAGEGERGLHPWRLCVADLLASLQGAGRALPAGGEERGGKRGWRPRLAAFCSSSWVSNTRVAPKRSRGLPGTRARIWPEAASCQG